jgi:porphobilinogen deaminase
LRQDLTFRDLRGTISQRLALLEQKQADGIVVAEAALIRLGLTDLNRIILPGETIEGQGQLAVLARQFDEEMQTIFACLDVKN